MVMNSNFWHHHMHNPGSSAAMSLNTLQSEIPSSQVISAFFLALFVQAVGMNGSPMCFHEAGEKNIVHRMLVLHIDDSG